MADGLMKLLEMFVSMIFFNKLLQSVLFIPTLLAQYAGCWKRKFPQSKVHFNMKEKWLICHQQCQLNFSQSKLPHMCKFEWLPWQSSIQVFRWRLWGSSSCCVHDFGLSSNEVSFSPDWLCILRDVKWYWYWQPEPSS